MYALTGVSQISNPVEEHKRKEAYVIPLAQLFASAMARLACSHLNAEKT